MASRLASWSVVRIPLGAALLVLMLAATAAPVTGGGREALPPPVPEELDLVPRTAAGFVTVRVRDLLEAPSLAWARRQVFPDDRREDCLRGMVKTVTGIDLGDLERATVIWPTADHLGGNLFEVPPEVPSRLLVLTLDRPVAGTGKGKKPEGLLAAALAVRRPEAAAIGAQEYRGHRYVLDPDGWTAFLLVGERTVVMGSRAAVHFLIDHLANRRPGPLDGPVRAAAGGPTVAAGWRGPKFARVLAARLPAPVQAARDAYTAEAATLTLDCRRELAAEFTADFADETRAARGRQALADACAAGAGYFTQAAERIGPLPGQQPDDDGQAAVEREIRRFVFQGRDALRTAAVEHQGLRVRLALRTESAFVLGQALVLAPYVLMPAGPTLFDPARAAAHDAPVARALLAYHAQHGHFPPPALTGRDGRPLLSWRVAVLPHLGDEAAALYRQFKLDEPWDSMHNRPLLDRMPAAFDTSPVGSPYRPRPHTGYRVYSCAGSIFEGPAGRARADVTDDPAATVLAVRTSGTVPWTKPDALGLDHLEEVPEAVILVDGTVKALSREESPETLRAAISRAGGETVRFKEQETGAERFLRPGGGR